MNRTFINPCFLSIIFIFSLCSCGVAVSLSPGTVPRTPKSSDYKIQVYQKTDTIKVKYSTIGLIGGGDSGFTISCSYETVLNKVIEKARSIGADAIQIVQVDSPNIISTCYEIKAIAIAYE
jgi:uncharacterized protein YbjQ (UPF0145 family)